MTSNFFPGGTPGEPDTSPLPLRFDGGQLHMMEISLIPEPTTLGLPALGGLALLRRRVCMSAGVKMQ